MWERILCMMVSRKHHESEKSGFLSVLWLYSRLFSIRAMHCTRRVHNCCLNRGSCTASRNRLERKEGASSKIVECFYIGKIQSRNRFTRAITSCVRSRIRRKGVTITRWLLLMNNATTRMCMRHHQSCSIGQ